MFSTTCRLLLLWSMETLRLTIGARVNSRKKNPEFRAKGVESTVKHRSFPEYCEAMQGDLFPNSACKCRTEKGLVCFKNGEYGCAEGHSGKTKFTIDDCEAEGSEFQCPQCVSDPCAAAGGTLSLGADGKWHCQCPASMHYCFSGSDLQKPCPGVDGLDQTKEFRPLGVEGGCEDCKCKIASRAPLVRSAARIKEFKRICASQSGTLFPPATCKCGSGDLCYKDGRLGCSKSNKEKDSYAMSDCMWNATTKSMQCPDCIPEPCHARGAVSTRDKSLGRFMCMCKGSEMNCFTVTASGPKAGCADTDIKMLRWQNKFPPSCDDCHCLVKKYESASTGMNQKDQITKPGMIWPPVRSQGNDPCAERRAEFHPRLSTQNSSIVCKCHRDGEKCHGQGCQSDLAFSLWHCPFCQCSQPQCTFRSTQTSAKLDITFPLHEEARKALTVEENGIRVAIMAQPMEWKTAYNVSDKIVWNCPQGFDLVGPKESVCDDIEHWSAPRPVCKPTVTCQAPCKSCVHPKDRVGHYHICASCGPGQFLADRDCYDSYFALVGTWTMTAVGAAHPFLEGRRLVISNQRKLKGKEAADSDLWSHSGQDLWIKMMKHDKSKSRWAKLTCQEVIDPHDELNVLDCKGEYQYKHHNWLHITEKWDRSIRLWLRRVKDPNAKSSLEVQLEDADSHVTLGSDFEDNSDFDEEKKGPHPYVIGLFDKMETKSKILWDKVKLHMLGRS